LKNHLFWISFLSLIYRLFPLKGIQRTIRKHSPWINALAASDLAGDVRGGDSFSDIYGLKRFILAFLPAWTVILVKGSIVHLPQTYGPFKTRTGRFLARYLLRRSSAVIARDKASQRVAQELVGNKLQVKLSPDVAFSLEPVVPDRIALEPAPTSHEDNGRTIIGLNVNGLMYHGGYTRNNMFGLRLDYAALLPELITALLEDPNAEIWLVPHTWAEPGNVESDNGACAELRHRLPEALKPRVRLVATEYDQHEIKGVIGQCDAFVGSRMHSCIAALSQGIPCVGIAYSMKFQGVFESVGMGDWVVDGREADNDEAIKKTVQLLATREQARPALIKASEKARKDLEQVFRELLADR